MKINYPLWCQIPDSHNKGAGKGLIRHEAGDIQVTVVMQGDVADEVRLEAEEEG